MTTLETAEKIIAQLSPAELVQFREWFAEFDNEEWDAQLEADAAAGKLDKLVEEALAEYHADKAKEIRGTLRPAGSGNA